MIEFFQLEPIHVYIGAAIFGLSTGLGASIGQTISKIWIEPYIKRMHKHIIKNGKKILGKMQ